MESAVLTHSLLYLDDVKVSFDGYKALRGLSLVLAPNEMRAIIGPNGAGKTTMMDVITGKTRPDTGTVFYGGATDLTKLDEPAIAELGIGRKFQKPTVFESHTVEDNILLALKAKRGPFATLFGKAPPDQGERIERTLAKIRLTAHRARPAGGAGRAGGCLRGARCGTARSGFMVLAVTWAELFPCDTISR